MAQTQERQAELIHEEDADQTSSASFTEHAGSHLSEDESVRQVTQGVGHGCHESIDNANYGGGILLRT
jgi:hypothetical protein